MSGLNKKSATRDSRSEFSFYVARNATSEKARVAALVESEGC